MRGSVILFVAAGSAIGGTARYLVAMLFPPRSDVAMPIPTLLINVTGSLLLGMIIRYATAEHGMSPQMRAFLTIGLCGGYTTFSTFSLETAILMERGRYDLAIGYVALSVIASVAAVFAGMALAAQLVRTP